MSRWFTLKGASARPGRTGPHLHWGLSGGDGPKDIYVQARDQLGNVGPARKLSLLLETTPPGTPVISSPTHPKADIWYNLPGVQFDWQAPADASGIAGYAGYSPPTRGSSPASASS